MLNQAATARTPKAEKTLSRAPQITNRGKGKNLHLEERTRLGCEPMYTFQHFHGDLVTLNMEEMQGVLKKPRHVNYWTIFIVSFCVIYCKIWCLLHG